MKRKSFLTTLLLLAAIGLPLSTARAQQVQVIVTPKYDPMPPQVMNYISQPGSYFNITLNNTSDEVQNVFLTMEVEQLVNGELHLITPNHILPNQAIVLPPNTPTPASSVALQNQFRHLYTSDIVLTGGKLSDYYDTGIVGLLPEGTYQLTIKAYQWLQGVKYPQLVSDPMAGKCTFNVCYSAQAPEITVPFYQSNPLSSSEKQTLQEIQDEIDRLTQEAKGKTGVTARSYDKQIAAKKAEYGAHGGYDSKWKASVVNNNAATFAWTSPIMNCGGTSRSYNYTFEVFPIGSGMATAEQAVKRGTIALTIPKLLTPSCVLTPDQVKLILQRNETGYFVARVTATPTITDKSNMLYSTLENDGHSQLLVFRFSETSPINTGGDKGTGGNKNGEKPDEIVDVEPEPVVNEEITIPVVNTDYLVYAPKLVSPDNSVRGVLEENGKVELKWEKPEEIIQPASPINLNYKYAINVYKKGNMKSLEQALKSDPIITVKDLSATKYTIPWSELKDKVKLNDNLVYSVTAACTSDVTVSVDSTDHRNVYQQAYGDLSNLGDSMPDCYSDRANNIKPEDCQPGFFSEKQIRDMEVYIGEFPLTVTEAVMINKQYYQGKGFVTWKPMNGYELKINVEFDELYINSKKTVYKGSVRSCREEEDDFELSGYIPYDIFDDCSVESYLISGSAQALGSKVEEYVKNNSSMAEYYKKAITGAKSIENIIKKQASVNLPISLSRSKKNSPIEIQILSATFSPTNAAVSVLGMLTMPTSTYIDNGIAIFGAPKICIGPESFAPEGATIALLSDATLHEPETDLVFDMKAPTNLVDLNDGCYMTFSDNGLDSLCFEAEMMIPGLIKADEKGNAIETEAPAINIRAFIKDWDNWIGTLSMDNFQLEEAAGFTFIPGGTGISYDHSLTNNAPGFTLPKNDGPVEYDKEAAGCSGNIRNWQGLYINKMGLLMPSFFDDESGKPVEISLNNLLFDDSGISFLAQVTGSQRAPIVKMHTSKAGGWGMSLESVNLNMISNKFASSSIIGAIKAPVIGGEWEYKTQMAMANYTKSTGYGLDILFEMTPRKGKEPVFDCFLSQMYLNESYTHFTVHNFEDETDVELELAGKITIMGSEDAQKNIPLDINIPGIEFTGMRMANFAPEKRAVQSEAASKKFSYTFDPIFEGKEKGDFWFDLGTWSLSSEEKKLGPFSFSLDNFGIITDNRDGKPLTGLNIVGSVGLLGESGTFTATAGVTVWAQIRSDLSNVETIRDVMDIKLSYAKTTLDEIGIKSEFGGCKVEGKLVFEDKPEKKGYGGLLEFTLPGNLFTMKADGGFFKCTDNKGKFMHAYFEAEIGSATGIPLGPVALNDIAGGFYFNTSLSNIEAKNPSEWEKTPARDVHGGMFGLGLSTVGSDRGLNAKMKMVVVYDARRNRLSTFRMSGEVHALCGTNPDNGLINADCSIVYQNLKQAEGGKYLQINITVDAGADMDNLCEQFIGQKIELPDGLSDLKSMEDKSTNKNKDAKDTKAKVSCGAHLALDIKVTMKPDDYVGNFKTKWHVYLGQPGDGSYESEMKNRCSITLIDYQVGSKNDPIAVWGKQWANAYLCIGNELPNDGALPPIPSEIKKFLDGKDANGQKQSLSATAEEKRKNIVTQFSGSASSGVMFGAQAGGEFGLNAVVCYANASLQGGFDIALTQLKPGTTCNGKPAGGSSGFYGTGQVYALAQGELGLMIDLWIFKGKLPLIDVGLGALLKGGFPNPSWFYGKVRAKCKLLGGLIKFNSSLTIEVGDVCIPDVGNPLDDIKIFGDMTPGDPEKSIGWEGIKDKTDGYSCYSTLGFTTNMAIGARLDLVDVNKANRMAGRDGDPEQYYGNCHRAYRFLLDPAAELYNYGNSDKPNSSPGQPILLKYITKNQENFTIPVTDGKLKACTYYKLVMKGKAQELINGLWQNPIFNDASTGYKDVQKDWTDEYSVYFHTTTLPNDLYQDVKLSFPFNSSGQGQVFRDDFVKPSLHLSGSRIGEGDDIFNPTKYTIRARVEKFEHGMWVPADATFKTRSTNGYAIDSNGDVNYFIKLDEKGNVVESQHDPFADTYTYTDTRNSWKTINPTTGLAWERMYRFIDTLNDLLTGTKDCKRSYKALGFTGIQKFGTSELYSKYATLRWVPTSYHSLNVAIKYYQELLSQDAKTFSNLSNTMTKLDALKTDIANTYSENTYLEKSTNTYAVDRYEWKAISLTDADIQYTTCPAKHELLTSSEKTAAQIAETTVKGMHTQAKKELDEGIKVSDGKGGEVLKPHTSLHADEADKVKEDVAKCYEEAKKAFSQYLDKIYCSEESNTIKKYICSIGVLKHEADSLAAAIPVCKKSYNDVTMQKINILGLIADARLYANPKHTVEEYREEIRKDSLAAAKALKKAIACYANHDYTMAANIDMKAICDSITEFDKWTAIYKCEQGAMEAAIKARKIWKEAIDYMAENPKGEREYGTIAIFLSDIKIAYESALTFTNTSKYITEIKGYMDAISDSIHSDATLIKRDIESYYKIAEKKIPQVEFKAQDAMNSGKAFGITKRSSCIVQADKLLDECYELVDEILNQRYDLEANYSSEVALIAKYTDDDLKKMPGSTVSSVKYAITRCEEYGVQAQEYYNAAKKYIQAQRDFVESGKERTATVTANDTYTLSINAVSNKSLTTEFLTKLEGAFYIYDDYTTKYNNQEFPVDIIWGLTEEKADSYIQGFATIGTTATKKVDTSDSNGKATCYTYVALIEKVSGGEREMKASLLGRGLSDSEATDMLRLTPPIVMGEGFTSNNSAESFARTFGSYTIKTIETKSCSAGETHSQRNTIEDSAQKYDVVITEVGSKENLVIKAVMLIMNCTNEAAKAVLSNTPPITVAYGVDYPVANSHLSKLKKAGASAKKTISSKTTTISKRSAGTAKTENLSDAWYAIPDASLLAMNRSTVPGVAEAHELTSEPDSKADAVPDAKAKPKAGAPAVPGVPSAAVASIISNMAASMNGKGTPSEPIATPASEAPTTPSVPTVPSAPAPPAEKVTGTPDDVYKLSGYDAANDILKKYANSNPSKATEAQEKNGLTYYADPASIINNKTSALPVSYHCGNKNANDVIEESSDFKNPDNYLYHWLTIDESILDYFQKGVSYRITIEQIDNVKLVDYLNTQKVTQTHTEEAQLSAKDGNTFLDNKGKAEVDGTLDLAQYMADYYQEMKKEELFIAEEEKDVSKITNKKDTQKDMFVQHIYDWTVTVPSDVAEYETFTDYAKSIGEKWYNEHGRIQTNYFPAYVRARPVAFKYYDERFSLANMHGMDDSQLFNNNFILKSPIVWLAYVGGYAFLNGRPIYDHTNFLAEDINAPAALYLEFHSSPYRKQKVATPNYTNGSSTYREVANLIEQIGVCYQTPSYNECLRDYNKRNVVKELEEELQLIQDITKEVRLRYHDFRHATDESRRTMIQQWLRYSGFDGSYPQSGLQIIGNEHSYMHKYQPYLMGMIDWWWCDHSSGDLDKYNLCCWQYGLSPEWSQGRNHLMPLYVAGGIKSINYKIDYQFRYEDYCNNLEKIDFELFRVNCWNTRGEADGGGFDVNKGKSGFIYNLSVPEPLKNSAADYKLDTVEYNWDEY